jgi:Ca2+-transporting ATPase
LNIDHLHRISAHETSAAIPSEREHKAWIEGVAIWVAVILVSIVGSVNDYQKELQFRKLNAEKDAINVKVVRDGKEQLVPNTDIVVGDVMMLDTGDKVIADGVEIEGHGLTIDEASLTGESDPIKKLPDGDFWIRSGSQVRILTVLFQVARANVLNIVGDCNY